MSNLPQFDPYTKAIKHYMFEIMPEKYTEQTDDIIDRVAHALITKKDTEHFIRFLGDIYQAGYNKAMISVSEVVKQHGFKLNVVQPK